MLESLNLAKWHSSTNDTSDWLESYFDYIEILNNTLTGKKSIDWRTQLTFCVNEQYYETSPLLCQLSVLVGCLGQLRPISNTFRRQSEEVNFFISWLIKSKSKPTTPIALKEEEILHFDVFNWRSKAFVFCTYL